MSLLAGACLAAASCSDSDEDTKLPSPNFPEAVSATIEAGGTYTLEIEPNQNWEVSVPTATAAWFWIQDETQKVWTLRGGAGASRIVIGVAELDEFDDTRVCEVTLKMGGQSKVIATITRGTLERGFSLRTCKIDEYGDFEYGDSETGLTYSYNEGEAQSIDLTWPEGRTDFSMPILVEANYEWAINRMPEWVSTPSVTVGQPGTKVEIRIQGNPSAYPLDGEHWSYRGENYPTGVNWDFNKDPDLWGVQPGVEVHSNGRVAKISIGEFGFRGHVPAAIGQLSELVELYLGTHNDGNLLEYDPSLAHDKSLSERNRTRMERHKEFLSLIHIPTQTSEPIARALAEHGISIPATSLYKNFTEDQIIDRKTGLQNNIRPYDVVHGKLTNGLKSIDPAIGKLEKLEYLNIANGELEEIPAEVANLKSLTDLEIYNCPKMTRFPVEIAQMPELVSVNISNNAQWSAEELYKGLDAIANGPSKEKLQILYATNNKLREIPESFSNLKKIGLLDLSRNQIETLHPLGKEVAPEQLYLDHNNITSLPANSDGIFCGTDDTETFSVTYNKLKKVPNIFSAKSKYVMKSVDFSYNEIDGFEGEEEGKYKGLRVETFSLAANPGLTKFPKCLGTTNSLVSYIILRGCSIDEIPEGSFGGKNSTALISLDLTYNKLKALSKDFTAEQLPYLYGLDISYNSFDKFPFGPLNCAGLTVYAIRGQRDAEGKRCLREWPTGLYQHTGLRGFYIGSNDLRKIEDTISYLIYHLDISDNPNITFDASAICYYWQQGVYNLIYDKTQNILNCDKMLE